MCAYYRHKCVWGHVPPENFFHIGCSEIASSLILPAKVCTRVRVPVTWTNTILLMSGLVCNFLCLICGNEDTYSSDSVTVMEYTEVKEVFCNLLVAQIECWHSDVGWLPFVLLVYLTHYTSGLHLKCISSCVMQCVCIYFIFIISSSNYYHMNRRSQTSLLLSENAFYSNN